MTQIVIKPGPGAAAVEKALGELARKAANPAGALKNIGEALLKTTRDRFSSQTAPDGSAWPAWSPLTVLLGGGAGGGMLRRSGRLFSSTNDQVAAPILRVGANAPPYDRAQQYGAKIVAKGKALAIPLPGGKGKKKAKGPAPKYPPAVLVKSVTIPPRPYIGFGPKDEAATLREIEAWLAIEGKSK
jgi:phage gpG-like protein